MESSGYNPNKQVICQNSYCIEIRNDFFIVITFHLTLNGNRVDQRTQLLVRLFIENL